MIENPLGFRAVVYSARSKVFCSPNHPEFVWDKRGIADASCGVPPLVRNWFRGGGEHGEVPSPMCSCGIYAANTIEPIVHDGYAQSVNAVLMLAEPMGRTLIYDNCWRAAQCDLVAIVNWVPAQNNKIDQWVTKRQMAILAAQQFFEHLPLIGLDVAREMVRMTWQKHGYEVVPYEVS